MDIVKRLRKPEGYIGWDHAVLMDEAADKIEQLRVAGDGLLNALLNKSTNGLDSVIEAWEDIHHG